MEQLKNMFMDKFNKLKFPFYLIKNYELIFNVNGEDPLKNFFNDKNDPVIPVYFLREEVEIYLNSIFKNNLIFKNLGDDRFLFRNNLMLTLRLSLKKLDLRFLKNVFSLLRYPIQK